MIKRRKKLIFGLSEKADGSMNIYSANCQAPANRKKFFSRLVINFGKIIWAKGVHGDKIALVNKKPAERIIEGVDGLISRDKNIFLALTVADCLPLYFYDSKKNIIGLAHAGWRGVLKNIAGKMAVKLINLSGHKNLLVYIGPHIKVCHFIIKDDVAEKFKKYSNFIKIINGEKHLDLVGVAVWQLLAAGVKLKNIKVSRVCTHESKNYFSFRRNKPKEPELMAAFIGMKNQRLNAKN